MKYFLLGIATFLLTISSSAQMSEALKDKIIDAEYFFLNEDYKSALELFKELYDEDPANANFAYRIGLCYQLMPFEAGQSIPYLEKATRNMTFEYNEGSYKERKAPMNALFYLGYGYHTNNSLDNALEYYQAYRDSLPVDDVYNIKMVERQIISVRNAKEISKLPVSTEIANVGNRINSKDADYNPTLTADGNTLIFTREIWVDTLKTNTGEEEASERILKILVSYLENDKWTEPEDISDDLATEGNCKTLSLSADGNELLLYKDDWNDGGVTDYKEGTIYYSKKVGDSWTPIKKLNRNINSASWESHATLSPDGQQLYFTSERRGGMGGLDIYVSYWEDGDWGPPYNLGPTINTPYDEETPFILADGKTLYFSSEGHYNMGGFDVFYSRLLNTGEWSEPVNVGYPINTTADNVFYTPIKDGSIAYYAVARHEGYFTFGDLDIYELEVVIPVDENPKVVLEGEIKLEDLNELDTTFIVNVIDTLTGETIAEAKPNLETGKYELEVSPGDYKLTFQGSNYKTNTKYISLPKVHTQSRLTINASMIPTSISTRTYFVIKNIYFEFNSAELNREALIETEKLHSIMKENPDLYIEVAGHTDTKGSVAYNKQLSLKRAQAVINYLANKGIEKTRFVARGMGEGISIAINENKDGTDNPEGRKLNRRVEMRIIKTDNDAVFTMQEQVPDELKYADFNRFSVAFKEVADAKTDDELKNLSKVFGKILSVPTDKGYIYYFGDFATKADASKAMNDAISKGYEGCSIMDYFEINKANKFLLQNPYQIQVKYTIQLKAVDEKMLLDAFVNLQGVKQFKTKDGFYRYTYKEFTNLNDAKNELADVIKKGYVDAFIIEVDKLK